MTDMVFDGYLIKIKEHYDKENPQKIRGVSLLCRKDPLDEKTDQWFGFWIHNEQQMNIYNSYRDVFEKLSKSGPWDYPIRIWYMVNEKGYNDIKRLEILKKSIIDKAFESAETVTSPESPVKSEDAKAFMPEKKEEPKFDKAKDLEMRIERTMKAPLENMSMRDLTIARESVVRATQGINDIEERIKACNRLMKWILTGE